MFQVVTKNSLYNVVPVPGGFRVRRAADLWGRKVQEDHAHTTAFLRIAIGEPMETVALTTSEVRAIVPMAG